MAILIWCLCLQFAFATATGASPRYRRGATADISWRSEPDGRGTFGIIQSNVLTLVLCAWTAMHLNVPPKGQSLWKRGFWLWAFISWSILFPDFMLTTAWSQRTLASELTKGVLKILEADPGDKGTPTRPQWTMVHSHYAVMGGFVLEDPAVPSPDVAASLGFPGRLTLRAAGIRLLAECGHLPNIDSKSISDKSKADSLAKALVLVQIAWAVVQIIGRLAQGQFITLLEVNTVGHIICAIVVYALWWDKPKDVHVPTFLNDQLFPKSLATFLTVQWTSSTGYSLLDPPDRISANTGRATGFHDYIWHPNEGWKLDPKARETTEIGAALTTIADSFSTRRQQPRQTNLQVSDEESLSSPFVQCFEDCTEAIERFPAIRAQFEPISEGSPWLRLKEQADRLVRQPDEHDVMDDVRGNAEGKAGIRVGALGVMYLACCMYDAVHLAAWNYTFPTDSERLLWKICALSVPCVVPGYAVLLILGKVACACVCGRKPVRRPRWAEPLAFGFSMLLFGVFALLYCGPRVFLVVEAFISLRLLPESAFETPGWANFLPHF